MGEHTPVYDLGDIELAARGRRGAGAPTMVRPLAASRTTRHASPLAALAGTLSLFVPGAGSLVLGRFSQGLFFLSTAGFLGATAWALVETMHRLTETLRVLGAPGAAAVWTLAGVIVAFVFLHVCSVLEAGEGRDRTARAGPHPAVAMTASALVPGWGQVLAGCPRRAAAFVACLWIAAAAWVLDAPAVVAWLDTVGIYLPPPVEIATSPVVRWTAPAVVWAVAVYDAGAAAQRG